MEQSYPSFSGLRYLAVTALWILALLLSHDVPQSGTFRREPMKSAKTVFLAAVLSMASMSLGAQIAPVCDSGGVCGTDPNQTTDPSYAGLLASRPMKQNARGSGAIALLVWAGSGLWSAYKTDRAIDKAQQEVDAKCN
jgi:hypothetical protein